MVNFKLDNKDITSQEAAMLAAAKKLPPVFDDDSPMLTKDMEQALIKARQAKPYNNEYKRA